MCDCGRAECASARSGFVGDVPLPVSWFGHCFCLYESNVTGYAYQECCRCGAQHAGSVWTTFGAGSPCSGRRLVSV